MPDDTPFDACVTGAGSLTDSALAALALLVPSGVPDAPELDWLRQHAGSVPALSHTLPSIAHERRLTSLMRALELQALESLAVALALEVESNGLLAHALARLQGTSSGPGALRPTLGLVCRMGEAIGVGGSERGRVASLLCGRALGSGMLRLVPEDVPAVERRFAVPEPLVAALIAPDEAAPAHPAFHPLRIEQGGGDPLPLPASWLAGIAREAKRLAHAPRAQLVLRAASIREARAVAGRIAARIDRRPVIVNGAALPSRTLRDGLNARFDEACRSYPLGFEPWLIATDALPVVLADPAPGETVRVPAFEYYAGPVIVIAGLEGELEVGEASDAPRTTWRLSLPTCDERAAVWRQLLSAPPCVDVPPEAIAELAGAFRAGVATLSYLAHRAALDVGSRDTGLVEQLSFHACDDEGSEARHAFAGLAQRVSAKVPDAALVATGPLARELELLLARCRAREALTDNLGLGSQTRYSPGVKVLFSGASGTGKTLAALWLAGRLAKAVYRVDLAAVSSKYIGETEKNLSQLLARAEHSDCVLLFDEADSLFGNRTEVKQANDRFANTQTNYLLQRIESFEGIAILTSNSKERIDDAFTRRLDGVIEFPLPDGAQRRALWNLHLGRHALSAAQLNLLAAESDLAGGHIRNAVLTAALLARRRGAALDLSFDDCVEALSMEYAKLGRRLPDGLLSRVT